MADYEKLRFLLTGDGASFKSNFFEIRKNLPDEMLALRGVKQQAPHSGIDPLDHTFNMMALLGEIKARGAFIDARDLTGSDREIVRCASLYHDLGKLKDAFDPKHGLASAELALKHLKAMKYSGQEQADITRLVATHDVLSRLAKGLDKKGLSTKQGITLEQALAELGSARMLKLHYIIIYADIESVPGFRVPEFSDILPGINRAYERLMKFISEKRKGR